VFTDTGQAREDAYAGVEKVLVANSGDDRREETGSKDPNLQELPC
jgi:hypothetical protein